MKERIRRNSRKLKVKDLKDSLDSSPIFCQDDVKTTFLKNFDKYDTSHDGNLDKMELTNFFRDILKRKGYENNYNPREVAEAFVNMVDKDGDGKISRE